MSHTFIVKASRVKCYHYFYGDFLAEQGKTQQAIQVLESGLNVHTRHLHPLIVQGRQQDIRRLLNTLQD